MAFQDQAGAWFSGGQSNFNPNPQSQEWGGNNWSPPRADQWDTQDISSQYHGAESYLMSNPSFGNNQGHYFDNQRPWDIFDASSSQEPDLPPCLDYTSGQKVDTTQTQVDSLVPLMQSMFDIVQTLQKNYDQTLEQHRDRILALEQTQSSSEKIIQEQSQQIQSLEETVQKLEARLKNQEVQREQKHTANLRRIQQANISVKHLSRKWVRVESLLGRVQQQLVAHIETSPIDASSDEEEWGVTGAASASTDAEDLKGCVAVECTHETGVSCRGCGLNCGLQLRACVNMIQVAPSMKRVKESELKSIKRTQKRKLQRIWVPRGIFDIKELYQVDNIIAADQCATPYMPRWKKRKRRTPPTNDSCD